MSSSDADKLSRTIKGFFTVGVITTIVFIFNSLGVGLANADINGLVDGVTTIISVIGILGAAIYGFYGALMKVINKFKK